MKSSCFVIALSIALCSWGAAAATDHGLKSEMSLPALLKLFMVGPSQSPAWDMGAGASGKQILWTSSGVEPARACGTYEACRKGVVRVTVRGGEIQQLRKRLEPIEWELFMASTGPAKFGPTRLEISPSCDTTACSFDFRGSLAGSNIALTQVCNAGPASAHVTAFKAQANGKTSFVVLNRNLGSGGESITLTVVFDRRASEAECADARSME